MALLKGQGAYLNRSTRLPLSYPNYLPLNELGDSLVGVEWGSDRSKKTVEAKSRSFQRLAGDPKEIEGAVMVHSLRSMGCVSKLSSIRRMLTLCYSSAALNYCSVAAGVLDMCKSSR